jgi:hypothetical protein
MAVGSEAPETPLLPLGNLPSNRFLEMEPMVREETSLPHRGRSMERVHKRVPCTIEYVGLESDFVGLPVPGFIATCSRCCHQTESIGTTGISIRRCLSQMREECPCGGSNQYELTQESERSLPLLLSWPDPEQLPGSNEHYILRLVCPDLHGISDQPTQ